MEHISAVDVPMNFVIFNIKFLFRLLCHTWPPTLTSKESLSHALYSDSGSISACSNHNSSFSPWGIPSKIQVHVVFGIIYVSDTKSPDISLLVFSTSDIINSFVKFMNFVQSGAITIWKTWCTRMWIHIGMLESTV